MTSNQYYCYRVVVGAAYQTAVITERNHTNNDKEHGIIGLINQSCRAHAI